MWKATKQKGGVIATSMGKQRDKGIKKAGPESSELLFSCPALGKQQACHEQQAGLAGEQDGSTVIQRCRCVLCLLGKHAQLTTSRLSDLSRVSLTFGRLPQLTATGRLSLRAGFT